MKCAKCGGRAAYSRKYSGESLCAECFTASILRKTAKTISRYDMIQPGSLVCVGVSGGKDSLALLHVLSQMSKTHNFRIAAATIDEGIPGYRDEALRIAKEYCGRLGVPHRIYSYDSLFDMTLDEALSLRASKASSCSICGTLRRRALDRAAKDLGADTTATAHNQDDMLQTFLINLISGDTARIGWTGPKSAGRIKPFAEIYESEIVFFAFANGIPFQAEPCPHMSEGIRTEVREFLNSLEERHAGAKNSLYRSAQKVSQAVTNEKRGRQCAACGSRCTGETCSACSTLERLKSQRQFKYSNSRQI